MALYQYESAFFKTKVYWLFLLNPLINFNMLRISIHIASRSKWAYYLKACIKKNLLKYIQRLEDLGLLSGSKVCTWY